MCMRLEEEFDISEDRPSVSRHSFDYSEEKDMRMSLASTEASDTRKSKSS